MKLVGSFLAIAVCGWAQQPGGRGPLPEPKNLKLLSPKSDIRFIMQGFNESLGVQCTYCHVQGDFSADTNPKKEIARKMIAMGRIIGDSFPSSAGVFPDGYHEVDCITCHRGNVKPQTKATTRYYSIQNFRGQNLGAEPGSGVALKVLPPGTQVHGADTIMGEFRDALGVDCNYCHGGGKPQETDVNPRKDIARKMILLVRQINTNFPGTGVYPVGDQEVTCWTCHRGDPHPVSLGNKRYELPAKQ